MRKRVYVAGAYSADNVLDLARNISRGREAALEVRLLGFADYCPWNDFEMLSLLRKGHEITVDDCYEVGLAWLEVSDALLVVEGWTMSRGTHAEIARAEELGIPVFYSIGTLIEWGRE